MALSLTNPSSIALVISIILVLLVLLYRAALPKPIPGIPYNKAAAKSILGDSAGMLEAKKNTKEIYTWMTEQCQKLNSPIVQLFIKPLQKPWIIVCDARECQDVLLRRSKEFDRAAFNMDVVGPILGEHHFPFPSGPKHKAHRALLADLMTPAFLNKVAAPQLHRSTLDLLDLWRRKSELAQGRPFRAEQDVANAAVDIIWGAAVGSDAGTTKSQLNLLNRGVKLDLLASAKSPVHFPEAPYPPGVISMRAVLETMGKGQSSPVPGLFYFFYLRLPWVKAHFKNKDAMLDDALKQGQARLQHNEMEAEVKSAMEYILQREILLGKRENRPATYNPVVLKDELFGFLLAGHETTSTTITWGLKFLADHQEVQNQLRQSLRDAIPEAAAERRHPTADEITAAKVPYFDAIIEEILRCGGTAPAQARMSLVDTEILGVPIPKGTDIIFMNNGPCFMAPPMPIDERLRSRACQEAKDKIGEWDPTDISKFKPERWLKYDEKGQLELDLQAGPTSQFGGGARGCFGRKFAYLEMRTVFSLLVWNFKLLPVAPEFSSYRAYDEVTHAPQQCYLRLAVV